jgi:hypothetical protein
MIGQAVETVIVVAMDPVTQGLPVHRAGFRGDRAASTRSSPDVSSVRVVGNAVMGYLANRTSDASTHERTDSGKTPESNLRAVGIRQRRYRLFLRSIRMDRLAAMEAFVLVVDAGSFSATARRLNVGQPAVSKLVAQLAACRTRVFI